MHGRADEVDSHHSGVRLEIILVFRILPSFQCARTHTHTHTGMGSISDALTDTTLCIVFGAGVRRILVYGCVKIQNASQMCVSSSLSFPFQKMYCRRKSLQTQAIRIILPKPLKYAVKTDHGGLLQVHRENDVILCSSNLLFYGSVFPPDRARDPSSNISYIATGPPPIQVKCWQSKCPPRFQSFFSTYFLLKLNSLQSKSI